MNTSRPAGGGSEVLLRPAPASLALALAAIALVGVLFWEAEGTFVLELVALLAVAAALFLRLARFRAAAVAATESMRENDLRFQSLSALSVDWYWEQDAELRFVFLSSEVNARSGTAASTRIGLKRWELPGIDLQSADWSAHEATCRAHQPFRNFVYRRVNESGVSRWNRVSGEPIFDESGAFKGYRGATSDVTGEKQAELEITRSKDFYAALSQTNRAIIHIREAQPLFDEICRVAVAYGHFRLAWIGIVNEVTGWVEPRAVHGPASHHYPSIRVSIDPAIPEGRGFGAQAIRDHQLYIVNDFLAEPRVAPWQERARAAGLNSLATFPLFEAGRCVGILNLHGHEVGFFTEELTGLLSEMAENISYALTNIRREEERRTALQALVASDQKLQQLTANIPGILWTATPTGQITYVSAAYERVTGRSTRRLLAEPIDWIHAVYSADKKEVLSEIRNALHGELDHEFRICRAGKTSWIHNRSFPVRDKYGEITLITGIAEDITARKDSEELLHYMARYDQLTGLPNRVLFYDRLQQALAQSQRSGRPVALVFADIDQFKRINDTLGHSVGDQLLQEVAKRLQGALRSADTVARLSGDEFAVILPDLAGPDDAGVVTQSLRRMLDPPFMLDGHEVFVTISAGISIFPTDGDAPSTLLKNADAAMYRAKEAGRNTYRFFETDMNARALERMSMDSQLRRALEREEFLLHYQPKVDLGSGAITGFEALLRWQHPEQGLVPPLQFISMLEDNGLIVPVGDWVLAEACRQAAQWSAEGWGAELSIAVNLSARQFQGRDPGARIRRTVSDSGTDPRLIELEITETVLMENPAKTGAILSSFKEQGMRLSVDDFGTGYSSLSYLKSFPLDALKIDRSFVRDVITDAEDALITRAVISLAHNLNLKVIAEGVETQAQRAFLTASGCDEMQGYLFSRPVSAADCSALLRQRRRLEPLQRSTAAKPTLLVVDDEPGVISLLMRTLRSESYNVLSADTAESALELLAVNPVGVVLTDHRMPGMSGVELLRRIKVLYPDAVRLVMSGDVDAQAMTEAINQGAVYKFIFKPWNIDELRSHIRQAFAHKALLDENRHLNLLVRELQVAETSQKVG